MRLLLERPYDKVRHVFPDGTPIDIQEEIVVTPTLIVNDMNAGNARIVETETHAPLDLKHFTYIFDEKSQQFHRILF